MRDWSNCKRILAIRADNMGDVLMSLPAITAIFETFKANITLLTSSKGFEVAKLSPAIADVIAFDCPWVKAEDGDHPEQLFKLVEQLKERRFDACIVFTVYSQNPMPSIMLAYLAGIPLRLAYCRENPYHLLTHWVPDEEPYKLIRHQVERDLHLVANIGATTRQQAIKINLQESAIRAAETKLITAGLPKNENFIILHPGVSEKKRQYPKDRWIKLGQLITKELGCTILITGAANEAGFINEISDAIGANAHAMGGTLSIAQLAATVAKCKLVIGVNTGIIHLAAAMQTPVVVLYAQTNPQHHPWKVKNVVFEYSIAENQKSKNQIIDDVNRKLYANFKPLPDELSVLNAAKYLLTSGD